MIATGTVFWDGFCAVWERIMGGLGLGSDDGFFGDDVPGGGCLGR